MCKCYICEAKRMGYHASNVSEARAQVAYREGASDTAQAFMNLGAIGAFGIVVIFAAVWLMALAV